MRHYNLGDRVSFPSKHGVSDICTVRYIGEVEGFHGQWLGVEWDDASRGKHDGSLNGKRYFFCQSPSSTAGSFVRPNRPADPERSFLEAIYDKYAPGLTASTIPESLDEEIIISGKVAQEIGFDKIRELQAQIHELRIVILDGMRISVAEKDYEDIFMTCTKIVELDLSRNLFRCFEDICKITSKLPNITRLSLNGNRISNNFPKSLEFAPAQTNQWLHGIIKLQLDEMLIPWSSVVILRSLFPNLMTLTASSNSLKSLSCSLMDSNLVSLALENNEFNSLRDLQPLTNSKSLRTLLLKGNRIVNVDKDLNDSSDLKFDKKLEYVDLSYNAIDSWTFVDKLPKVFPGLTGLRISNNPLYLSPSINQSYQDTEESFMITVGRIGDLRTLNYSNITTMERNNAEIYYLSTIAKEIAQVPETEVDIVLSRHERFKDLCNEWGPPVIDRKSLRHDDLNLIEGRLIGVTFKHGCTNAKTEKKSTIYSEIPKSIDVYRVKALVKKLFCIPGHKLRLIWETGEWDPVAGYQDVDEESSDEDIVTNEFDQYSPERSDARKKGITKWIKREVEINDSTRQIGSCIEGANAVIRVIPISA